MCAGQTAVHPVGVLGVRLAVLTGNAGPLFLVSFTFLLHKGSCKLNKRTVEKQLDFIVRDFSKEEKASLI